jgi:hypothetical protein
VNTPRDAVRKLNQEEAGKAIPADSERIARPMNWHGPLTVENAAAVRDRIERTFAGQRYTYASVYVASNGYAHQSVRTGQVAEKFELSISHMESGGHIASITVPDSNGLWYLDTSVPTRLAANLMTRDKLLTDGAVLTLGEHQLQIETMNYEGATWHTTIACERHWNLEEAVRGVLREWDALPGSKDPKGELATEIGWLRDALGNGQ